MAGLRGTMRARRGYGPRDGWALTGIWKGHFNQDSWWQTLGPPGSIRLKTLFSAFPSKVANFS
jgi:hypothetical protein